jgi:hypothetical protein
MIGEETSGRLDVVPTQYRVVVTHRPKFSCRSCEKVVQKNAPEHLIKSGPAGAPAGRRFERGSSTARAGSFRRTYRPAPPSAGLISVFDGAFFSRDMVGLSIKDRR